MSRIKDLLLRNQENQDQPNPNEIKLSFNDQWFLLTTMVGLLAKVIYDLVSAV